MGLSTWPELQLNPLEETPLLQAARLRRFGVNYLQDAVCAGLGLLAHLDGSHVRLLAFSPRGGRGEQSDGASGGIVADIDLEAGRTSQHPDEKTGKAASSLRREGGDGLSLATTFRGPARGLSWGRCRHSADSASAESGDASVVGFGPHGLTGVGVSVGAVNGGRRDQGGECHIAVACGSEVRLWKVSRVPCDARLGGSTEEGETGNQEEVRHRYSTVSVRTDWHRGSRDSDSGTERKNTTTPTGDIRCLSFRPCGGADMSVAAGVVGGENVPLTAWFDAGAAVLGSGGSRVVLPAPVIRERACGAWSGCGRRLAVSSGGEIRVYSDPSEEHPLSMAVASDALEQRAVQAGTVRGGYDPTLSRGTQVSEALPLATEVFGGWLSADEGMQPADRRGVAGAETNFRTALCVEATMYEGVILSSPGSSPGGTPSTSSPSARQARTPLPSRSSDAYGGRGGRGPMAASSSAPRTKTESGVLGAASSSPVAAPVTSKEGSSSPPLIGDMRTMCPGGPLAFFGTTDGGLGLDSVLAPTGSTGTSGGPFSPSSGSGITKRGGSDLLGAIVNTSTAARTAASDAGDGGGIEKLSRRGGFRHVLPGENWLAGSLRPSSRSGSPSRHQQGSSAPESPRDNGHPESSKPTECVPVVQEAAGRGPPDAAAAVVESVIGESSRPTAAPEVLDLRGKLGDGASGGGGGSGGAGGASLTSTHPLFRLSLPGGADPIKSSVIGNGSRGSAPNTGKAAAAPVRRPWLVRVSCRNRSSGGNSGSSGVGVKALASLPPGLVSPDLLASSDDGRYVAVGSHACDLVACFRLQLSSSGESCVGTDGRQYAKSASDPVAEGKVDKGGVRQRKRRHRRAVPLCTLRMPPGYRAKGLTVVKGRHRQSGRCGTTGTAARASSTSGTAGALASDDGMAEEVVVLVLGGCAVTDARAAASGARRSSTGGALFPAELDRRGSSGSSEEKSYRTVLLRYVLPSAPSETAGSDVVRDRKGPSDGSGNRSSSSSSSTCAQVPAGSKEKCPASAPSSSCGEQMRRGASSISVPGSPPSVRAQSFVENETGKGDGTRLEAVLLEAVAGAERRMDDRFDRIERMLVGVCDRLGALEDVVKGQRPS